MLACIERRLDPKDAVMLARLEEEYQVSVYKQLPETHVFAACNSYYAFIEDRVNTSCLHQTLVNMYCLTIGNHWKKEPNMIHLLLSIEKVHKTPLSFIITPWLT